LRVAPPNKKSFELLNVQQTPDYAKINNFRKKAEQMKILRHYRNSAVAVIITVVISIWLIGCQSKTASLIDPSEKITRETLENEFGYLAKKVETNLDNLQLEYQRRLEDLQRQDEIKRAITEASAAVAQSGTINPLGIVTLLAAIMGIGSIADNRKKDGIIAGLKSKG
jgi:high-affinity Fe2+/Pb2+ permease